MAPPRILPAMLLACVLWCSIAVVEAAVDATAEKRQAVADLMRDGHTTAALDACRAYNRDHPGEPTMLYNLACLEAIADNVAAALDALQAAVDAGFADLDHAATDPDLATLAKHPDFQALMIEHNGTMLLLARERGLELIPGAWTEYLPLHAATDDAPAEPARIALRWRPLGLDLELVADGAWTGLAGDAEPAEPAGGPALVVALAVPDPQRPWLSDNAYVFTFDSQNDGAQGAVWVPTVDRWQVVTELAPKIRVADDGLLRVTATIPWAAIMPYHPLVDSPLGFNVSVKVPRPGGGFATAAVMPDPSAFAPQARQRRIARLDLRNDLVTDEVLFGRVDDSLVYSERLGFELVACATTSGPGRLIIDFLDAAGNSVLPTGPRTDTIDLQQGFQRLNRQADFTDLKEGSYLVRTELDFPSGHHAVWSTRILNLAADWREDFVADIATLDPQDRPTAQYLLDAVTDGIADHRVRRDPGPIAVTLAELATMLAQAAQSGSILPPGTSAVLVYPGPSGADRLCTIYRPQVLPDQRGERAVLVLNDAAGHEARIATRIAQIYANSDLTGAGAIRPVYLVPHLPAAARRDVTDATAEAQALQAWATTRFGSGSLDLVGIDFGGGPALRLAVAGERDFTRLLVFAGRNLLPWPGADAAETSSHLRSLPPDLSVTWIDFAKETRTGGQGPLILRTLETGDTLVDSRSVRGPLSLSQACDRLVLWAEDLDTRREH